MAMGNVQCQSAHSTQHSTQHTTQHTAHHTTHNTRAHNSTHTQHTHTTQEEEEEEEEWSNLKPWAPTQELAGGHHNPHTAHSTQHKP
jgi:hypothetical protein